MSNTATVVKMFVEAKSKFGVLNSDTKKWMNPLNKSLLSMFEIGKGYEVTVDKLKGDDGKHREYITEMRPLTVVEVKQDAPEKVEAKPAVATNPVKAEKSEGKALGFAEKDARILVQGITQALLQSSLMNMVPDQVHPLTFLEENVAKVCDMVKRLLGTK